MQENLLKMDISKFDNKLHYVYVTTNLINGKQYVGDHTINIKERKYYLGSGSYLRNAVKYYGEENFFKEILEWGDNREEISKLQEKYIKEFNTLKPNGYNISPTGGIGVQGCHSEKTKQQIGKSGAGKSQHLLYKFIDPNGVVYENIGLRTVCRINNLSFDTMRKHINYGKIKTHKTYNINTSTLNCENWEVIRKDKPTHIKRVNKRLLRDKLIWEIISPSDEKFYVKYKELTSFISKHNLDWRTFHKWEDKGKIKIRNKASSNIQTLNTQYWEIKKTIKTYKDK